MLALTWTDVFQDGLIATSAIFVFVLGALLAERLIREGRRHRWRDVHNDPEPGVGPKDPMI